MLSVFFLRTEYLENPIGLDAWSPRLGWKLQSDKMNVIQKAYQVQASHAEDFKKMYWDSGIVQSDQSQRVLYTGPELKSMERIYWRVKVWSEDEESGFSESAYFEMGLLNVADWKARWIEPEKEVDFDAFKPASYIRKEFTVNKGFVSARAYLTAKGLYSFYLNGNEGTENLFTPGFTSYYKRLQYQAYDITGLLQEGNNVLGVILADGWWRGSTGGLGLKNNFGYKNALLGQIIVTYEDGTTSIISSDSSFKTSHGPLIKSDMKDGDVFDARINIDGWNKPGYNDSDWVHVNVSAEGLENLLATRSVPVKRKERFSPAVLKTPNGETVLDFRQNLAGWVEMKVRGPAGTEVVLVHGETLGQDGNFSLLNITSNPDTKDFQEVHYILRGENEEIYSPQFSIFGFRYALLKNYPGEVNPENFTAVAVYSAMEETGDFTCSNPLINQLASNSKWSQKGNFMEVPTDCPTRERAGWTGDAQVYCRTASDFMNVYPFFEKWMIDVAAEQADTGAVLNTIPCVLGYHNEEEIQRISKMKQKTTMEELFGSAPGKPGAFEASAGWGDAAVIIPWTMYLCYGDKKILEQQYSSAKAWVDYIHSCAKNANDNYKDTPAYNNYTDGELDANYIWDTRFHWGEWLEADLNLFEFAGNGLEDFFAKAMVLSDPLVATAYYAYSSRLLSEIAGVLGNIVDEEKYLNLFEKVKRVYNKYFIKENGIIQDDRQAPNVRTLAFDLAYEDKKQAVADRLAELVKEKDYHLNTGFLSTPFILHVLSDYGYPDVAFKLLEQKSTPSWLYPVSKGATTILEAWSGIQEDGLKLGSFNHYSYGAVCDFLFAGIAGIRPEFENPGYKHFVIKPSHGGTLTSAQAKYDSLYGIIESGWKKIEAGITYKFTVPANTKATVMLPGSKNDLSKVSNEFKDTRFRYGRIVFEVGSGSYTAMI